MYKKISPESVNKLKEIVGEKNVISEKEKKEDYSHDEFALDWIKKYPEVVVKPGNTEEVSAILKLANQENFPVTPRGGATGLCGSCVPMFEGVVLSLENMNKVIEIDKENLMAHVESGVTLMDFYKEVEKSDLFFPPHPGDESAHIGGVIATNAGGSRAVKYGVIANFIRGIEVVLPNGEITNIGGKLMKNSTGYSLLHLMIGSEGTLGIITKAILNLLPPSPAMMTLVVPFENLHDAIKTVPEIIRAKIIPMAIEFIEKDVIQVAEKHLNKTWPTKQGKADLMIIVDGPNEDELMKLSESISEICINNKAIDVFVADSKDKQKNILDIRSQLYESIKRYTIEIMDIVIPRAKVADFVDHIHKISDKYQVWLPTYGHAADGNVHTHPLKAKIENGEWKELEEEVWKKQYPIICKELYEYAKNIGGMLSGEHGIGIVKKEHLPLFIDKQQINLMKSIKKMFDPANILNPGKIFDL